MSKAKQSESGLDQPFVLKHRVAGAAALLFFGALVLPWMLGPPSEPDSQSAVTTEERPSAEVSSADIEDELLAQMTETTPVEEEVYISKITPLDSETLQQQESDAAASSQQAEATADQAQQQESTERAKRLAAQAKQKADSEAKAKRQAERDKVVAAEAQKQQIEADKQSKIEADLAAALSAEASAVPASRPAPSKIERGYVVQVGLYENQQGAQRVLKDLRSKGFSPSTTVVDTNRGKNTGTRVWLGPFAQRVDAGKARSRLAELTGQGSFIREYP